MAESETPVPSFSTILEYLHLTLRYVASGFIAVGIYMFLCHTDINVTEKSWFLIFLTAAIGIITYALHFATLDKVFYGKCVLGFIKKNNNYIPAILATNIIEWYNKRWGASKLAQSDLVIQGRISIFKHSVSATWLNFTNLFRKKEDKKTAEIKIKNNNALKRMLLFALANQTYMRQVSSQEQLVKIQNLVERRLALLNFLYCSFYQVAIISIYCTVKKLIVYKHTMYAKHLHLLRHYNIAHAPHHIHDMRLIAAFSFSVIILYSAIKFNRRICSREMWIVTNFPQKVDELLKETEKTTAAKAQQKG